MTHDCSQPLPCQDHALHVKIPEMDSADANTIKTALDTQAYWLKHHDTQLSNIAAGVKQLTDSQADLQASVATKGKSTYRSDAVIDKPTGGLHSRSAISAGRSGSTSFAGCCCCCASSAASARHFPCLSPPLQSAWPHHKFQVFQRVRRLRTGSVFCSAQIQQGCRRVVDYALEFRMLAADSGWNETSIISAFVDGLAEEVKDFLAPLDIPRDFESLVEIASRIDNHLRERERERDVGRVSHKSSGFQGCTPP
ncbi:hypothetical protein L3Q82_018424 [Scortum barcoo]|uniref:Uncharacterized protein n=1 Tax=Scortum barcoo TaxID=214431 RepID=A0ACB8VIW0_9TELE|nr:hypothetical protein L3Q82_018424 [Scortum barcoo]